MDIKREDLSSIPHKPGAYLFKDGRGRVIYVGKSKDLRNRVGSYFIELAKEDMRRHFINLPDADLAYLSEGTRHFEEYLRAVSWAQRYALTNRELMMAAIEEDGNP